MEDMQTIIILLTVIVGILSIMVIVLMSLIIMLLIKMRKIAQKVDDVTKNIAKATEWLSPMKIVSEIAQLFKK